MEGPVCLPRAHGGSSNFQNRALQGGTPVFVHNRSPIGGIRLSKNSGARVPTARLLESS